MIDDEGNAYGGGRLFFDPPVGSLPLPESGYVRIASGRRPREFALCQVRRHPDTGYLVPESVVGTLRAPDEFALMLAKALRTPERSTPLTFAADLDGELLTDPEHNESPQGLSDWRGSVTQVEGGYLVSISAALQSLQPLPTWSRRDDLPLADGEVAPRIRIEFSLDAMTAVVRFGGYSRAISAKREPEPSSVVRTSLDAMRLDKTPLGFLDRHYGWTDDDKWVSVYESQSHSGRAISIDKPGVEHRTECGLMTGVESRFPRLWFNGIDLDVVVANMWWARTFAFTMTGGRVGDVKWEPDSPDGHGDSSKLLEATLEFELTVDGLIFRYSALPGVRSERYPRYHDPASAREGEPRLFGEVTIPWEVLIIRAPMLLRHRKSLLNEEE